jgi:hypothetical protein
LICIKYQQAIYSLDEHLKRRYSLPVAQRRQLLATYQSYALCPPKQLSLPAPSSAPIAKLGPAQDSFLCCQSKAAAGGAAAGGAAAGGAAAGGAAAAAAAAGQQSASCSYVTTNRKEMRKHINQQHSVKLSR